MRSLVLCSLTTARTAISPAGGTKPDLVAVSPDPATLELDVLGREVLERAGSSVLVLRSRTRPRTCVCIGDGDDPHLARMTVLVSRVLRPKLTVLYVPGEAPPLRPEHGVAPPPSGRRGLRRFEAVLGAAEYSGVARPRFEVLASARDELLHALERHEPDLVLVGAQGLSTPGSLVASVVDSVRRSVLCVRRASAET